MAVLVGVLEAVAAGWLVWPLSGRFHGPIVE